MKNSNIFLLFLIFFILIVFISCIPPENNNSNDTDSEILEGSLLIINSWGEGLWENVPDGKYRITFDAAKKVNLVGYLWAKDQNDPKAILRFNITHALRSDCEIKVVIGDSSSDTSIFYKNFINLYMGMGDQPFPSNDMIVDITEAYQYLNTKNIYLVVYDKTDNIATGTVDKVKLQVWNTNSYDQTPDDYDATYDSVDPSGTATQNGIYKTFEFTSHKGTIGFANPLFKGTMNKSNLIVLTDKPSSDKLAKLKAQMGTHQKGVKYNKIYHKKFGTGLKPPTEEQWKKIASTSNYIIGLMGVKNSRSSGTLDKTQEIYFPPIGNQGMKNSCASFNSGYYVQTYYTAKLNDWDISGTIWNTPPTQPGYPGEPTSNTDKIISPQFLYQLVNGGVDEGSYPIDNIEVLTQIGITTWNTNSYEDETADINIWPNDTSFEEAPLYRGRGVISGTSYTGAYILVENNDDINYILSMLDEGYLFTTGVDANYYDNLSSIDVWTDDVLPSNWTTNHANTIVGYTVD